ncbi:MAG TPA: aminopeptidase [Actinomycetota bacterium]|nr:aminopeptidase [Actinomycetota bacterium]
MTGLWRQVAARAVDGIDPPPGGLVVVRDRCGRPEPLWAVTVELERRGVTALAEIVPDPVLVEVLATTPPERLEGWSRHRAALLESANGVVSLAATLPPLEQVPQRAAEAWLRGRAAMHAVEARRGLPFMVLAVPTARLARDLGRPLGQLDQAAVPAMAAPLAELRSDIGAALALVAEAETLVLETPGCRLVLHRGDRVWLSDDGQIAPEDRARGAVVSNLPAGSVYTTVLEDRTEGSVRLSAVNQARDVVLTFHAGRVVDIQAARDASAVRELLDRHTGDSGRVGHVGFGLNRHIPAETGWSLLDHHRAGAVFLALGENRYMGGVNASTLNEDFLVAQPTLSAADHLVVDQGALNLS